MKTLDEGDESTGERETRHQVMFLQPVDSAETTPYVIRIFVQLFRCCMCCRACWQTSSRVVCHDSYLMIDVENTFSSVSNPFFWLW